MTLTRSRGGRFCSELSGRLLNLDGSGTGVADSVAGDIAGGVAGGIAGGIASGTTGDSAGGTLDCRLSDPLLSFIHEGV